MYRLKFFQADSVVNAADNNQFGESEKLYDNTVKYSPSKTARAPTEG